jgi:hypothetical protein
MSEALINSDEDWQQLEGHARQVMKQFDRLPAAVQKVIRDTGVDDQSAWLWLQHLKCPDATAAKLRELMSTLHAQELAEAAAWCREQAPRLPSAARRRP